MKSVAVILVGNCVLWAGHWLATDSERLTVRTLTIVDEAGRTRMTLGADEGPQVTLYDKRGEERVTLSYRDPDRARDDARASLAFHDHAGRERLRVGLSEGRHGVQEQITFTSHRGRPHPYMMIGRDNRPGYGGGWIEMRNEEQAILGISAGRESADPEMHLRWMRGEAQEYVLYVGTRQSGSAWTLLAGSTAGAVRTSFDSDGSPSLVVDKGGTAHSVLDDE